HDVGQPDQADGLGLVQRADRRRGTGGGGARGVRVRPAGGRGAGPVICLHVSRDARRVLLLLHVPVFFKLETGPARTSGGAMAAEASTGQYSTGRYSTGRYSTGRFGPASARVALAAVILTVAMF